jgi:ribosome-interacting GTPase 1
MNLTSKLQALKEELKLREAEKNTAHARIILLRRKIKEFERVMKEAEPFFEEEKVETEVSDNGAHSFTESANL